MKKKGVKAVAWLVILTVAVMMLGVVSFAETVGNFYITVDKTTVNEGDTVTVTVSNKRMTVGIFTGGFTFDKTKFEVLEIKTNPDILGRGSTVSSVEEANSAGTVGFAWTDFNEWTYEPGMALTATMRAKEGGSCKFQSYEDSDGPDGATYEPGEEGSTVIDEEVIPDINLIPVEGKAATCTEAGYEAYWMDEEGNMYSDEQGRNKIDAPVVIPARGHTPAEPVKENVVEPTCTAAGSHDEVVYCSVCKEELSRNKVEDPAKGHTPAAAVKENVVEPACTSAGSHDEVVYCSVCKEELSRNKVDDPAKGHTPAEPVKENVVESTCTSMGHFDEVVYCADCGAELSRRTIDTAMLSHVWHEEWTWEGDQETGYTAAHVKITCALCGETDEADAEITVEGEGKDAFYTAVAELRGEKFTDTKGQKKVEPPVVPVPGGKDANNAPVSPKTADNTVVWPYILGMALALFITAAVIISRRKIRNKK